MSAFDAGQTLKGVALVALAVLAVGCAGVRPPRTVKSEVYKDQGVRVYLRHQERGGEPVAEDFSHPVTLSPIRLTRILASVDIRERDRKENKGERKAAVSTGLAYQLGEGLAAAFAKAEPHQEVMMMGVETKRRLGVFSADHLTSLVAWVHEDRLFLYFGSIDALLSDDPTEKAPQPQRGKVTGKFKVLPARAVQPVGPQSVAVLWRNEVFAKSGPIRTVSGGRILRRTVLMGEDANESAENSLRDPLPADLSPDTLRALAELEEARRAGELTEGEYQHRRDELMRDDD